MNRVRDDSRTRVWEWGGVAPFVRTGVDKPLRTVCALGAQLRKGEVGLEGNRGDDGDSSAHVSLPSIPVVAAHESSH